MTIFFVIPNYVEKKLGDKVQGEIDNIFNNNNNDGALPNNNNGIAVGEPNPNGYNCSSDVYNCANFTTQSEAQYVFDYCEQQGKGDIHNLDGDGNGKACEGLA